MMELARLAPYRARVARPSRTMTAVASRMLGAFALIATLLVGTPVAAQTNTQATDPTFPDLRLLVLGVNELPGYTLDAGRSTLQDRNDGTVSYDAVFTRDSSTDARNGPAEIRLAVARTASGVESMRALAATRDALVAAGWSLRPVPLLGDESVGFEAQGGAAVGAGNVGYGYLFRF